MKEMHQWERPDLPAHWMVAPKSLAAALVFSFVIPGVGTMYAGRARKGLIIFGLWVLAWALTAAGLAGLIFVPAIWIWAMVAGYRDARKWNEAHGIIS